MAEAPNQLGLALQILAREATARLRRHPGGHRVPISAQLRLPVRVPVSASLPAGPDNARALSELLDQEVDGLVDHYACVRPGRVFCLRCGSADCDHGRPEGPLEVFAGYSRTGVPRFLELGQRLLELRDGRVDLLFRERPGFVTLVESARDLSRDLLAAYRARPPGVELLGQVCAGWYRIRDERGLEQRLALSIQAVATGRRDARRFALNPIAADPGGDSLERLYRRLDGVPWTPALRWGEAVLSDIQNEFNRRKGQPRTRLRRRIDGLLGGLARRLERPFRGKLQRTAHGEQRHLSGQRPTGTAVADLLKVAEERVFFDGRHETFVVLGPKGRIHVFNPEGRLVTSLRLSLAEIEKRQGQRQWQPAPRDGIAALRDKVRTAVGS